MENLRDNPFSSLFPTIQQADNFKSCTGNRKEASEAYPDETPPYLQQHFHTESSCIQYETEKELANAINSVPSIWAEPSIPSSTQDIDSVVKNNLEINRIIEEIFLITLDNDTSKGNCLQCVFLEDLSSTIVVQNWLDLRCLEQAVFERLMLSDPKKYLVPFVIPSTKELERNPTAETRVMYYLFQCYSRWNVAVDKYQDSNKEALATCYSVIAGSGQTALAHPEIFPDMESLKELMALLFEYKSEEKLLQFIIAVVKSIESVHQEEKDEPSVLEVFSTLLDAIAAKLGTPSLADITIASDIEVLQVFACCTSLAQAFMDYNTPKSIKNGKAYESTLLGSILSMSSIPKAERPPFEFFNSPGSSTQIEHERMEQIIWNNLEKISSEIYQLLHNMLRLSPEVKHAVLSWIGNCLCENSGKAKLWNNHMTMLSNWSYVSDGFMLNLGSVLLHLCQPFSIPKSSKLTLIDPTYCAGILLEKENSKVRGLHLRNMTEETCLIPAGDGFERPQASKYNFTTECFYMTHRCLQLGFNALHERLAKIINDLRRLQRLYFEAVQSAASTEPVQEIKNEVERVTSLYLCTKTHMMHPETLDMMLKFHLATATWLVNVAVSDDQTLFHDLSFPLEEIVPVCLCCLPEFIIDNVADFASFLRRFNPRLFENSGESLEHFMTLILVFMGSPERMNNPHLRAKLAEALDGLMPHKDDSNLQMASISVFYRENLFKSHPHVNQVATMLLRVFVGIEMTGQSVAFEQKFNYRRPMYEIMAYILDMPVHKKAFKRLAKEAENDINSAQPPLFLRFINLLVNDAIYLLDEGLLHMTSLREHQRRRATEDFRQLSHEQQQEAEANFRHTGMLAQFHNVMGKQTINTLRLLTREVVSIFVHPTMVDRVAAMLNYFLLHLVGPKSRAFKVRDMGEYEFKPQELVAGICEIYINLGQNKAFWEAVATDGRSYSPSLFSKAQDVLCRIGRAVLVPDFLAVAKNVKDMADNLKIKEEGMLDAPDEFLDPIMGTFMYNPVILPSSHVIVDHSTIARHLLSDQTDPFNRSPLTMDMINPSTELKMQIEEWLLRNKTGQM